MVTPEASSPIEPNIGTYNDAIAGMYDNATRADGWFRINDFVARSLRTYNGDRNTALDLGAGTGQTLGVVQSLANPEKIVAVDASAKMFEILSGKYPAPNIETVQDTIEHYTSSATASFDIITAIGSLEFVPELPAVLSNLGRLLNDNGILVATFIPRRAATAANKTFQVPRLGVAFSEYRWEPADISQSLGQAGLEVTMEFAPAYERGAETVEYGFITAQKLVEPAPSS